MPPTTSKPSFNTKSPTIKRILQESRELSLHPDSTLHAAPLESNLFEWHFTLAGPPSTPYSNGIYHGRIILPPTYPLRPPSFRFLTPSGRFEVNREICLSISGHHEESWQPAWGIRTALCAIRAFMEGEAKGQVGGLDMGEEGRKRLAKESRGWRCVGCGGRSNEDVLREVDEEVKRLGEGVEVGERKKEVVPEGLRLGYRDEWGKKEEGKLTATASGSNAPSSSQDPRAPLASATHPLPSQSTSVQPTLSSQALIPSTAPSTRPTMTTQPQPQLLSSSQQGVPPWVDKAIVGILISLAIMLLKKIIL